MISKKNFLSLLLLSNFNNIISMQVNNLVNNDSEAKTLKQSSALLDLPEEIRQYIIGCLLDTNKLDDLIEEIHNAKDIFELYSLNYIELQKKLLNQLNTIRLTSKQLKYSAKYYVNKLRSKEQEFINEIKEQYFNYSKERLNNELKDILNLNYDINRNNLEEATRLIIAGADINLKNENGETILTLAVRKGKKDIVTLLLNHKDIDINIQNDDGHTALMWATEIGYKDIVELLLKHNKINFNIQNNVGYSALMIAIIIYRKDIVELLLNHKDINVNLTDYNGNSSLILAVARCCIDIVELLLNHKDINVNIKDNTKGDTALIWAARHGYRSTRSLIPIRNKSLSIKAYKDIVELLINHKDIDINIQNKYGNTALNIAQIKGHKDIEELIKSKINKE